MPNEVEIRITADDMTGPGFASALAKLAALKAAAKDIGGSFSPDLNIGAMTTALMLMKQKMQSLGVADFADINQTPGRIFSQLMLIKRMVQQTGLSDMLDLDVNTASLASQMAKIKGLSETVPVNFDVEGLPTLGPVSALAKSGVGVPVFFELGLASLLPITGEIQKLESKPVMIPVDFDASKLPVLGPISNLGGDIDGLNSLSAAFAKLAMAALSAQGPSNAAAAAMAAAGAKAKTSSPALAALIGSAAGASGGGGGGTGMLGLAAASAWFGKKFSASWAGWGTAIGGVSAWHIVLDGAIEATIIAASTLAALAAAAEALGGTALNLYQHLEAVYEVNSALGTKIPPLTDRFVALQKALAPQGIEIYGAALNAINQESGSMAKALVPVTNLFTTMAAKFDLWLKGFGNSGKIFQAGIGFLGQLGNILGDLGSGIANLIKDDPGIARFLLDIVQGTTKIFDVITKLPQPLVEFALGLHGAYVWGSVLAGLLGRLGGFLGGMYNNLIKFYSNPWGWVVTGAALLVYLGYEATQADAKTKAFIDNLESGLSQLSGQNSFDQMTVDIGQLQQKMNGVSWQNIEGNMDLFHQVTLSAGYAVDQLGEGLKELATPGNLGNVAKGLDDIWHSLEVVIGGGDNAFGQQAQNDINAYEAEMKKLQGGQANEIEVMAKLVKGGNSVQQAWALMTIAGVKSNDSVAVAYQKVQNLIAGYKDLSIRGGILANSVNAVTFSSLQQQSQVSNLNSAWSTFFSMVSSGESGFLSFLNGTSQSVTSFTSLASAVKAVHGQLNGLSAAQLGAQQEFVNSASAAQTEMNNLTLMASAAGLGGKGTDLLTQANKDMVASMLPAAKSSTTLTGILYALAQQGGYQGADSFQALSKWVGNTQDPMKNLAGIVQTLTKDSAGLTQDVKNLSDALGTTLNNAMATAIFDTTGGQKIFNQFAQAVLTSHGNLKDMVPSATAMAQSLVTLTGSTTTAKSEFVTFTTSMGLSKKQADVLWQDTVPSLVRAYKNIPGNVNTNITANDAQAMTAIHAMEGAFRAMGDSAQGAAGQVFSLTQNLNHVPQKTIDAIHVTGSGAIDIATQGGRIVVGGATGMLVRGGTHTQDSVPAMLKPGELVVPDWMVAAGYADGMRGLIPGFAGGGYVGNLSGLGQFVNARENYALTQSVNAATVATAQRVLFALEQATKLPGGGGGTPNANAALAKRLYPAWGSGSNWAYWNAVALKESGWQQLAMNPGSGAFGIAQALGHGVAGGGGKYGNQYGGYALSIAQDIAANNGSPNPQIVWMHNYIADEYGSPAGAWSSEVHRGYYDHGGWLPTGTTIATNNTGSPEWVSPGGSGTNVTIEIGSTGNTDFDKFMLNWVRKNVRLKGGKGPNSVQRAFGQ